MRNISIFAKWFQVKPLCKYSKKKGDMQQRKIILPKGAAKRLRDEFGVSYPTVRRALCYRFNSELCKAIRQRALQLGGKTVVIETTFEV